MKTIVIEPTSGSPPESPDLWSHCLAMTEHAPLPMASMEGERHIVRYVNPAFCRLMDKSKEELVGSSLAEKMPKKDECQVLLDQVYLTGKSESHTEHQDSESSPIFWSYTIWPVIAQQHTVGVMLEVTETAKFHQQTVALNEALMLGSVRLDELIEAADASNAQLRDEISERKQAQGELHEAQTLLKDRAAQLEGLVAERTIELSTTNKQLEAFVYTIAHDLRAPLRAMQGFSAILVENEPTLSEAGRDYANRINKSAQFMDALLIDLLAFSRISQQSVVLTSVNLKPVVETVLFRLQSEILEKNAQVDASGPWPAVLAHEPTVAQVFINLTSNALKFVLAGVLPRVRLRAEEKGEFIRIWVEDNGRGIAPNHQEQIFRLFTRLDGDSYPGTGIGLAIVQKGVERMGGAVGVESVPGQGSRFWFDLRKAPVAADIIGDRNLTPKF